MNPLHPWMVECESSVTSTFNILAMNCDNSETGYLKTFFQGSLRPFRYSIWKLESTGSGVQELRLGSQVSERQRCGILHAMFHV